MGNKFGNFSNEQDAIDALVADGFVFTIYGNFKKQGMTQGNLIEPPRATTAIVEITNYTVDAKHSETGKSYQVFQHHFID
jgi:hypothetical protein